MTAIKLYWWREASGTRNFGDDLSPILVERLSGRRVEYAAPDGCELIAIGSLLESAVRMTRGRIMSRPFSRARVWGTGSFGDVARGYHHLKYLSVRGPRTRDALKLSKQTLLGDPALLLAELVDRPAKAHRWGIIPHVAHRQDPAIRELGKHPGAHIIDLGMADPLQAAREIAACDFVISSSLHGLIAADAFGVPSVWTTPGDSLYGGIWKFYDYFESVGRLEAPVSPNVCLQSLETNASAAPAEIVASLCRGLRRSFPYQ